jgi:hypothetical protein
MIQIEDVVVPTKGTGKYLEVRALTFDLSPTSGISLYWAIYTEVDLAPGANILEGNLHLPQEQYEQWGTDDTFVTDWTLTQLNLTKI